MPHHDKRLRARRWTSLPAVTAGILLLTVACGGPASSTGSGNPSPTSTGSSPSSGSSATSAQPAPSALAFARCMRAHGVADFPDSGAPASPSPGSDLDPANPTYLQARRACQSLQPTIHPDQGQAAQDLADALKYSQCMRAHGITGYPDPGPHSGPGGGNGVNLRGIDLNSPQFHAAQQACRQYQSPTGKG